MRVLLSDGTVYDNVTFHKVVNGILFVDYVTHENKRATYKASVSDVQVVQAVGDFDNLDLDIVK